MPVLDEEIIRFEDILLYYQLSVKREKVRILQLNIGKRCNQRCIHCHVDAGPHRVEAMTRSTMNRALDLLSRATGIHTVDITGGAPELNPDFRYLVNELRLLNKTVIDRSNLSVFFEQGQQDTPKFLARNMVQIIASLPCYLKENVDLQRGRHVYRKSIAALKSLNHLGYGKKDSGLILNLVYNPLGDNLPPDQATLESDYRNYLKNSYNIEFNQLLAITNMPIKRFAQMLAREGKYESYIRFLTQNFNPDTAQNLMCRELLSIGWDGKIYDCDFNQAIGTSLKNQAHTIWDISDFNMIEANITFDNHCFGCTAGKGSSCKGALA